jgi:hypothetical protein
MLNIRTITQVIGIPIINIRTPTTKIGAYITPRITRIKIKKSILNKIKALWVIKKMQKP